MPNTNSGSKNRKKLFLFLGLIVSIMAIIVIYFYIDFNMPRENNFHCDIALQNGDLVFRKGRSIESQVVLITDRASSYSHVSYLHFK